MSRAGPRNCEPETGGKSGSGKSTNRNKVIRRKGSSAQVNGQLDTSPLPNTVLQFSSDVFKCQPTDPLATTAESINAKHAELMGLGKTMMEKMIDLGRELSAIKEKLPHGEWQPWVEQNLKFSPRTARRYLDAYEHRNELTTGSNITEFLQRIYGNVSKNKTLSDSKEGGDAIENGRSTSVLSPTNLEDNERRNGASKIETPPAFKIVGVLDGINIKLSVTRKELKLLNHALRGNANFQEEATAAHAFIRSIKTRYTEVKSIA